MTEVLARVAESVAPLAPREHRRATQLDRLRVAEIARRIDEGDDELDAAWTVLSDAKLGLPRWRGMPATARPSDVALSRKVAALFRRAVPALLDRARDLTLARVVGLSEHAVQALGEMTSGDFEDAGRARVQLDAARAVLEAVGVGGRSGGPSVQTAVQINVVAREHELTEEIDRDPEARRLALDLHRHMASRSRGLRHDPDAGPLDAGATP